VLGNTLTRNDLGSKFKLPSEYAAGNPIDTGQPINNSANAVSIFRSLVGLCLPRARPRERDFDRLDQHFFLERFAEKCNRAGVDCLFASAGLRKCGDEDDRNPMSFSG
jgi:hypothetical protein